MNVPHQPPHRASGDPLGDAITQLAHDLNVEVSKTTAEAQGLRARIAAAPAPTPAARPNRPPVVSAGGGGGREWGPSTTRIDHPLAVLENAAQSAYELHRETEQLLARLTGEQRQQPIGPRPVSPQALLPAIDALASEIEVVLNEVRRLLEHMAGRL